MCFRERKEFKAVNTKTEEARDIVLIKR